ncbi:MAG: MCP four helix bundle domain-containing protein, partial [Oscillospiraceae bacterium]|nr:MCP four helix bundle domain-containing protein [Oscillospiraceae bacterium]
MKIGAKLITSFIAVALIAGIVGVQGISNIQKIDKKDTELYKYMTVPIEIMGTVSTEFASIRFDTRDLISATSPADIDKYEKNILDRRAKIASSLEEFEKTIQSSEVRDIY